MRSQHDNIICADIGNLIEGYAIGALEQDEMLLVADHIADCPEQQEALLAYEETVGILGLAVTPVEPPAALWDRLRTSTSDMELVEPIPLRAEERRGAVVPRWVAMALAAAAVLLLVSSVSLGMALRDERDDEPMFDSTMATYLTSGGRLIPLASHSTPDYLGWAGRGSLLVAPDMPPMVVVDKCVPTSSGYAYVVWLQSGEQRTPMGQIEIGSDGRGMMKLEGVDQIDRYDMLGISIRTDSDHVYDVITGPPSHEN
jgi:hypothetical protein